MGRREEIERRGGEAAAGTPRLAPIDTAADEARRADLRWLTVTCVYLVVLLFTPLTVSLDDIKIPLLLVFGPALFVTGLLWRCDRGRARAAEDGLLLAFLGACLVSTLAARYPWLAWQSLAILVASLGFYAALVWSIGSAREARWVTHALVALLLVEVAFGIFHYAGGFSWLHALVEGDQPAETTSRLAQLLVTFARSGDLLGTFLNEDFFAGYLAAMAPLAVAAVVAARTSGGRLVAFAAAFLAAVCCVLTLSKESLLALLVGLAVTGWGIARIARCRRPADDDSAPARAARRASLPLVAAAAVTALVLGWLIWPRLVLEAGTIRTAFSGRFVMWRGALAIWERDPVVGAGPGAFRIAFSEFRAPDYFEHEISNVTAYSHSLYLDALCETGLLGFLVFAAFLVAWWRSGVRAVRRDDADAATRLLSAGFLGAFAAVAIQNLSSPWSRWPVGALTCATIFGAGSGIFRLTAPRRDESEPDGATAPASFPGVLLATPGGRAVLLAMAAAVLVATGYLGGQIFRSSLAYRLANAAYNDGRVARAIAEYERALQINPRNASALYHLGGMYHALGMAAPDGGADALLDSLAAYRRLETVWPNYAETPHNVALVERALAAHALARANRAADGGDGDDDSERATTGGDGGSSAEVAEAMHDALAHLDNAVAAARAFRRLSEKYDAYRQLGQSLMARGRFLREYAARLAAMGGDVAQRTAAGDWREAAAAFRGALTAAERREARGVPVARGVVIELQRDLLEALKAGGDFEAAVEVAEAIYATNPERDGDAIALVELLLIDLGDYPRALEAARRTLDDNPFSAPRLWNAMRAAFFTEDLGAALAYEERLRRVLRLIPDEGWAEDYGKRAAGLAADIRRLDEERQRGPEARGPEELTSPSFPAEP